MDRRGFLHFLGMGVAAAVAAPYMPQKTYSFIGGILRPKGQLELESLGYSSLWMKDKIVLLNGKLLKIGRHVYREGSLDIYANEKGAYCVTFSPVNQPPAPYLLSLTT